MRTMIILLSVVMLTFAAAAYPQNSMITTLDAKWIAKDLDIGRLDDAAWKRAHWTVVDRYWSGEPAPSGRRFKAALLWSAKYLYIKFDAEQNEPLVVSKSPDLKRKTIGLWDRDVLEIFIAPDRAKPHKYFEFELAPTGEWIDLGIEVTPTERKTDWEYASGMSSAVRTEDGKVVMAMKIPFSALGKAPKTGDLWMGNLFRCVGRDPGRGYLAWRPTRTEKPNFHVPDVFGGFHFAK
ncbi:MAG: carbohydrate-binding family 9-like protein [Acidobacteria bacterium]|nr:carbohydrate-binding family 9-like protein [Acidobacteriota bacterium]MCW5950228.1 carbohydrate-binding family 9-like protein [Pyrinomonadaceae bacterium]